MLKLTKTGIGLLTKQYRSVLRKCWAINVGVFALGAALIPNEAEAGRAYDNSVPNPLTGQTLSGYSIDDRGGAIIEYNTGRTLSFVNDNFTNNTGAVGGAIFTWGNGTSISSITGSNFTGNRATSSTSPDNFSGGAIALVNGHHGTIQANFTENSANGSGGAIAVFLATGIDNILGTFLRNNAKSYGGALSNTGIITNINADFEGNTSTYQGGAVYSSGEIGTIIGKFTNNTSTNHYGGAIYNTGRITSISGDFSGNTAVVGGAIHNNATNTPGSIYIGSISGTFTGNSATAVSFGGGAIYNQHDAIVGAISGTFENNQATNGGAIMNEGRVQISSINADFEGNTSTSNGGAIFNAGTIISLTGNFIGNSSANYGGAIRQESSAILGLKADTQDVTFYNNTVGTGASKVYNDISSEDSTLNLNATGGHKISFGGTVEQSASGTVNINTDNLIGGTYVFNNKVRGGNINIGSSTAENTVATTVKMGTIVQADGSESSGQFDSVNALTNYAANSILDMANDKIEAQNVTTLYLANAMKLYIDAKLSESGNVADTINATNVYSGSSGTTAPTAGSLIIDKINLVNTAYSDSGKTAEIQIAEEDSDLANALTVSDDVLRQNNNMNYYTKVDYDNGKIIFSDKLINESGFYEKIGSWSYGHYILNSTSSSNSADATHLTVGQALSALDEKLYNYYYTFRVDERTETAEFALFLNNEKLSNVFEA